MYIFKRGKYIIVSFWYADGGGDSPVLITEYNDQDSQALFELACSISYNFNIDSSRILLALSKDHLTVLNEIKSFNEIELGDKYGQS